MKTILFALALLVSTVAHGAVGILGGGSTSTNGGGAASSIGNGSAVTNLVFCEQQYFPIRLLNTTIETNIYLKVGTNVATSWVLTNTAASQVLNLWTTNREYVLTSNSMVAATFRITTPANTAYSVASNTWNWMGPRPIAFASNSVVYLMLRVWGTNETDVDAMVTTRYQ